MILNQSFIWNIRTTYEPFLFSQIYLSKKIHFEWFENLVLGICVVLSTSLSIAEI